MYANRDQVKVGELTHCHGSAVESVVPNVAEVWLGSLFTQRGSERSSPLCDGLYAKNSIQNQDPG